jgi:hypothetical protein
MLTAGQIAHFETFGFLVLRQLFTPEEAAIMKREAIEIFDEVRGGKPFTGEKWEQVQPFFERKPFLSQLPSDDRFYELGESLLGPDFFLIGTEGNLHVGQTPWHGGPEDGVSLPTIKITFYSDSVTKDTGALRVVPGSHRRSSPDYLQILYHGNRDDDFMPFGVRPWEVPYFPLESQPGDLMVFTENVLHSSFGGKAGRHQHAVSFMANPKTDDEVAYIRNLYAGWKYALHPPESYVNSDHPRLRRMVSRLVEWGFETSKV